jgi:hypothetical protein
MKHALPLAIAAALLAAPATADESADQPSAGPSAGEIELAELLEGREAGEPVRCLRQNERDGLQVIDSTALVFRDGRTLYVNRPRNAQFLDEWDVPVFRQFTSSLCELDQVEMRDRSSLMPGPVLVLDEFVPYTKPAKEEA